jgi:hypothetical protein
MNKYPDLHGGDQVVVESKATRRKRKEQARGRMAKKLGRK